MNHSSPLSSDEIAGVEDIAPPPNARKQHSLPLGAQATSKPAPQVLGPMMTPAFLCRTVGRMHTVVSMHAHGAPAAVSFPRCQGSDVDMGWVCAHKENRRSRYVGMAQTKRLAKYLAAFQDVISKRCSWEQRVLPWSNSATACAHLSPVNTGSSPMIE